MTFDIRILKFLPYPVSYQPPKRHPQNHRTTVKYHHNGQKPGKLNFDRSKAFLGVIFAISAIMIIRLFSIQVLSHNYYQEIAIKEHYGYNELPAHRGEIFIKDYASNEQVRVATNITLDLLYADPTMIKDKKLVADRIVPIIYDKDLAQQEDLLNVQERLAKATTAQEAEEIKPLDDNGLYNKFYGDILAKISEDQRQVIILSDKIDEEVAKKIQVATLSGIEITPDRQLKAYPPQIGSLTSTADTLGKILNTPSLQLENLLKGRNRYVILKRKIPLEISSKIEEAVKNDSGKNFIGLGLKEEYFRYYPEKTLASNILGFVTPDGEGSYGIESSFNTQLRGTKGVFQTQKDSVGRLITVGESLIQPAVDGANVTLTIDRTIQLAIENKLKRHVESTRSYSGQALVMDPKTGAIIAMANYPSFDANSYSDVYEKVKIDLKPEEIENLVPVEEMENTFWLYIDRNINDRLMVFKKTQLDGTVIYQRYKNRVGPEAYQNKTVSDAYEPGSVFKTIVMSMAIDDQDVTPSTSINDSGELKVDEFTIHNVSAKCTGHLNMAQVLANSCNTGMAWVSNKLGRSLLQSYLIKYGFGRRTEIEFDNELPGKINKGYMADSELATAAFGQGLTVTPIQIGMAYSAIANKGVIMQPHIVESIESGKDRILKTEPTILGQVISPDTARTMTEMLIGNIEEGVANKAKLDRHYLAGKTGTSQTYKHGKALTGVGTTIATMAGFGPINDPKFVIFVKLDHPHNSEWSEQTSVPLFKEIAEFLYQYYSVPPDRK